MAKPPYSAQFFKAKRASGQDLFAWTVPTGFVAVLKDLYTTSNGTVSVDVTVYDWDSGDNFREVIVPDLYTPDHWVGMLVLPPAFSFGVSCAGAAGGAAIVYASGYLLSA